MSENNPRRTRKTTHTLNFSGSIVDEMAAEKDASPLNPSACAAWRCRLALLLVAHLAHLALYAQHVRFSSGSCVGRLACSSVVSSWSNLFELHDLICDIVVVGVVGVVAAHVGESLAVWSAEASEIAALELVASKGVRVAEQLLSASRSSACAFPRQCCVWRRAVR